MLTPLERAVLEKILDGDLSFLFQLRQQLAESTVAKRELTGFGFYTTIAVPENLTRRAGHSVKFGDVIAEIPGLSGGAGFLLYIENGILDVLEGYSYDEPWPTSTEGFTLRFLKGEERDWKALSENLKL